MDAPEIRLVTPDTPELLAATREIFREYAASLAVDLCFQADDPNVLYATTWRAVRTPWSLESGGGIGTSFRSETRTSASATVPLDGLSPAIGASAAIVRPQAA